eukprot:CAMPEP_0171156772 /NCGR_PEP_ID=MMETSP0790-20130122/1617_1 /TAXON_ID=2925 /ORGANISM="Alexandrium catenella, Strain OF101" /LENGTH=70 /DNA_ID=CAMNT_0011621091 /DNA_START=68 /DNA_END=277 /DNA_ORIENTATION=+
MTVPLQDLPHRAEHVGMWGFTAVQHANPLKIQADALVAAGAIPTLLNRVRRKDAVQERNALRQRAAWRDA